jgi:hypothetical protein
MTKGRFPDVLATAREHHSPQWRAEMRNWSTCCCDEVFFEAKFRRNIFNESAMKGEALRLG